MAFKYTSQMMERDLKEFKARNLALKERADKLVLFHEDGVMIQRIDMQALCTFLYTDSESKAKKDNVRLSWYGKVLQMNAYEHPDAFMQQKKSRLAIGDIVTFNADTPFSLNIDGFYDIWVLSLQNILAIDKDIDIDDWYSKNLLKRIELAENDL